MALRWYTIVVDCLDVGAQSKWWAEALGWKPVVEMPDEVVLVPGYVDEQVMAEMPWERVPPALVFVPGRRDRAAPCDGRHAGRRRPVARRLVGRVGRPRGQRVLRAVVARPVDRR
jgi:hypothetical protein